MATDVLKLRPTSLCRPFDWRYQLAQHVVADDLPARAREWVDAYVERAAAVLRGDRPDAAVEAARQLRLDGPPLVRGELDGRILVGHPAEMIAGAMNVPAEVVELYEALFYDVRPRSIDDHWRAAGGAAVGYGVTEPEALIRWSGYKGLVASVAKYFRRGLDKEAELKESSDLAGEELELMRSCRRWVEVLALSAEDPVAVFAYMAGVKPLTWPVATRRSAARRPPCAERS